MKGLWLKISRLISENVHFGLWLCLGSNGLMKDQLLAADQIRRAVEEGRAHSAWAEMRVRLSTQASMCTTLIFSDEHTLINCVGYAAGRNCDFDMRLLMQFDSQLSGTTSYAEIRVTKTSRLQFTGYRRLEIQDMQK